MGLCPGYESVLVYFILLKEVVGIWWPVVVGLSSEGGSPVLTLASVSDAKEVQGYVGFVFLGLVVGFVRP